MKKNQKKEKMGGGGEEKKEKYDGETKIKVVNRHRRKNINKREMFV